ncbi:MAG TPA: hypothetical protein VHX66_09370 [Solirubrobacteraceae bacterium]|nr:hypothetical protein [Solirubrobacteraceae bacterium]
MRTRVIASIAATALLGLLIGLYIGVWATQQPAPIAATSSGKGSASLTLQTDAAVGPTESPQHPDWVSYLVRSHGRWIHSTIFTVPAHSLVHVTIYQFDGDSGLRNPFLAEVEGTVGGTETLDGKAIRSIDPDAASHTFVVPSLGLFVPLPGVPDSAKNPCGYGPCALSYDHETITFTFRTGGKGRYRWQCFVPCAAGTLFAFGGPMQTLGYMDGFLDVA